MPAGHGTNLFIRLNKLFKRGGTIRRRCRWQFQSIDADSCSAIFLIQLMGCGSRTKNSHNLCLGDNGRNVIWNNIFNTCITCANDCTTLKNIPQGDMMLQEKRAFFFDCRRQTSSKHTGNNLPEPVLRMAIVKTDLTRFWRRNRAKQQDARFGIIDRVYFVQHNTAFLFFAPCHSIFLQ